MSKTKKIKASDLKEFAIATIPIDECPAGSMVNLHYELGKAEINGHKIRFVQHVNLRCFWLTVDDTMYQLETEKLMNAVLSAVMEKRGD
jgi:hypothetical protein